MAIGQPVFELHRFGQSTTDLIQQQADQWFGAGDVRRRNNQVQRDGMFTVDEVIDAPVASRRDLGDRRIPVARENSSRSTARRIARSRSC